MTMPPREYRIVQDVPLVGLRAGDVVLYDGTDYTVHRRLTADHLLLRAALAECALSLEQPAPSPSTPLSFPSLRVAEPQPRRRHR